MAESSSVYLGILFPVIRGTSAPPPPSLVSPSSIPTVQNILNPPPTPPKKKPQSDKARSERGPHSVFSASLLCTCSV
ncbi:hypothetical protein AGOR_G00047410 [Albula goreensis]|uniref:Uncharacterized protein n=1 Tax=Albula goreensis TaxID=1534307 RepID=A0A8T3DW55_9TELE|nr:hypothetical protein AGOR_G00047410 [Albula goreensis]